LALSGPVLLGERHVVEHFQCGSTSLDAWLKHRALANQTSGASRTWVVLDGSSVVAYYASASSSILRESAPKPFRRNQPDVLPAVLLTRLAVGIAYQGRGVAEALLKHFMLKAFEVSQSVGVRVVLVHAKDDAVKSFYERYGFISSPLDPLTLMHVLPNRDQITSLVF